MHVFFGFLSMLGRIAQVGHVFQLQKVNVVLVFFEFVSIVQVQEFFI